MRTAILIALILGAPAFANSQPAQSETLKVDSTSDDINVSGKAALEIVNALRMVGVEFSTDERDVGKIHLSNMKCSHFNGNAFDPSQIIFAIPRFDCESPASLSETQAKALIDSVYDILPGDPIMAGRVDYDAREIACKIMLNEVAKEKRFVCTISQ